MTMRRYGWLLLALAACADGDAAEEASAADPVPAAPAPAPAPPPVEFAAAPTAPARAGRFASNVDSLPVTPPAGSARFCHGGTGDYGFGLVLKTTESYAIHLYRAAGMPQPGVYAVSPRTEQAQDFGTADGFYLAGPGESAVPVAVMSGGEVVVDSAGPAGVAGTLRLRMRTHQYSGEEATGEVPASPLNPYGYDPRESVGTITTVFRAVDGGSCLEINAEMVADTPKALRNPGNP